MIKYIFFFIPLFVMTTVAKTQVKYFVQADGNLSVLGKMKNKGEYVNPMSSLPNVTNINTSTSFNKKVGAGVKGGVSIPISSKLSIEAMVNVDWINYRQKNRFETYQISGSQASSSMGVYYNAGQPISQSMLTGGRYVYGSNVVFVPNPNMANKDKDGNASLVNAGIKGSINYKVLPKTKIGLGVGASTLLFSQTFRSKVSIIGDEMNGYEVYTTIEKDKSKDGFNKVMFSGNFNIEQQLNSKISVTGGFLQQLNGLYKQNSIVDMKGDNARMRYLSLGLRYYIN